jgi:hypothetical protein
MATHLLSSGERRRVACTLIVAVAPGTCRFLLLNVVGIEIDKLEGDPGQYIQGDCEDDREYPVEPFDWRQCSTLQLAEP